MCVCSGWGCCGLQHCEQHWRPDQRRHTGTRTRVPDTGDQTSSFPSGLNHIPLFSSTGNQTQLVRKSSCFSFEWRLNEFNHLQCWTHPVCSFGNQISFIFWKPNESTTIESRTGPHYTTWKPNDFSQTWTRKHHQTSSLITVFWTFTSSGNPTELITYSSALLTVSPPLVWNNFLYLQMGTKPVPFPSEKLSKFP